MAQTQRNDRPDLVWRLAVRGAVLAGTVGSAIILVLFYLSVGASALDPYSRNHGYAQLAFHPLAIPFVCLGVSILGSGFVPFGALLGWLVNRKRYTERACPLMGTVIFGVLPSIFHSFVIFLGYSPSREEPTVWAVFAALLASPGFRWFLVETAAVAAVPGALLGWHLWRKRETWLREIE